MMIGRAWTPTALSRICLRSRRRCVSDVPLSRSKRAAAQNSLWSSISMKPWYIVVWLNFPMPRSHFQSHFKILSTKSMWERGLTSVSSWRGSLRCLKSSFSRPPKRFTRTSCLIFSIRKGNGSGKPRKYGSWSNGSINHTNDHFPAHFPGIVSSENTAFAFVVITSRILQY